MVEIKASTSCDQEVIRRKKDIVKRPYISQAMTMMAGGDRVGMNEEDYYFITRVFRDQRLIKRLKQVTSKVEHTGCSAVEWDFHPKTSRLQ